MIGQRARRKPFLGLVVLVALALGTVQLLAGRDGFVVGLLARQLWTGDDAARQTNPPPYGLVSQTTLTSDGVITLIGSDYHPNGYEVRVDVKPPAEAVKMQLSDNVGFLGASWQPVEPEAVVPVTSIGYQTIFARFELADGSTSPISVAGAELDPYHSAATSSLTGQHEPSWVRPFSATELAIRVEAGRIHRGSLEPYDLDNPPPGDDVVARRGFSLIKRNGQGYGLSVSQRRDVIRRGDGLIGKPLDIESVVNGPWTIASDDDSNYQNPVAPDAVRYIARPVGGGFGVDGEQVWAVTYDLVITAPTALIPGSSYTITPAGTVAPITFTYEPDSMLSPAVQVAHTGIGAEDEPKVGFLAGWFDGLGSTATAVPDRRFNVVDTASGSKVFEGIAQVRPGGDEIERGDLTGAPVFELDFTPVTTPGRYRLCVSEVGCSYHFDIDDDVWLKMADTVGRSIYHQRSGVELGPPFTPVQRPRPYHPDDGVTVNLSEFSILEAQTSTANTDFELLVNQSTSTVSPQAWGGHFDAGDWDRRINHLWYVRTAAMLVSLYPETFADRDLNLPESGDTTPDILDEALWSLDLYRRMQREDGAISGGIEASRHPPSNSASWVDDLAVYQYAPDIYSSYIYAGVAAEVGAVLQRYDPARAAELSNSAALAMEWAESQWPSLEDSLVDFVKPQRNVAAAAMLSTTGDRLWHDVFMDTVTYLGPSADASCQAHRQCDGAWLYLQASSSVTDAEIRDQLLAMFRRSADEIVAAAESTSYGWTMENPGAPLIWGLGSGGAAHNNGLLRAYILTGDEHYRQAALRSTQVALGANPQNRALMTGVGHEPVRHPQINDVKHGGLSPWPGVPVYGRHLLNSVDDDTWVTRDILVPVGASPNPVEVPYLWQWYDISTVAFFNEFTVHQGLADALWTFGVLAATAN